MSAPAPAGDMAGGGATTPGTDFSPAPAGDMPAGGDLGTLAPGGDMPAGGDLDTLATGGDLGTLAPMSAGAGDMAGGGAPPPDGDAPYAGDAPVSFDTFASRLTPDQLAAAPAPGALTPDQLAPASAPASAPAPANDDLCGAEESTSTPKDISDGVNISCSGDVEITEAPAPVPTQRPDMFSAAAVKYATTVTAWAEAGIPAAITKKYINDPTAGGKCDHECMMIAPTDPNYEDPETVPGADPNYEDPNPPPKIDPGIEYAPETVPGADPKIVPDLTPEQDKPPSDPNPPPILDDPTVLQPVDPG